MTTPISPSGTVPDGSEPNRTDPTESASERSNRRPRGRCHPSRRTALKAAGISSAILATGAAGEGAPYELWRQWSAGTSGLRNLVAAATLAANPHNIQPWFFDVSGDNGSAEDSTGSIDLRANPDRVTPLCDPDGRERAAGFGCALYAIEVAARAQGKRAEIEPWPDGASEHPDHIARIRIVNDAPPTSRNRSWPQQSRDVTRIAAPSPPAPRSRQSSTRSPRPPRTALSSSGSLRRRPSRGWVTCTSRPPRRSPTTRGCRRTPSPGSATTARRSTPTATA